MPILKIEPIAVTTYGGFSAEITGVNPESSDCFVGTVTYGDGTTNIARWNLAGLIRGDSRLNIDTGSEAMFETRNFANRMLSPDVIR